MSDDLDMQIKDALAGIEQPVQTGESKTESPEDVARAQGWRPLEEFEGDKSKWVDAGEFNRRKPLFDKIHDQSRELKDVKKAVEFLVESNRKIEERTRADLEEKYERKIAELDAQRRSAIREGDEEQVYKIDEQIKRVEKSKPEEPVKQEAQPEESNTPKEILDWVGRNKWYDTDEDLREFMNIKQAQNLKKGMSVAEALQASEKQVRQAFAHKFENPNKEKPQAVLSSSQEQKRQTVDSLPPEMRTAFKILERHGMKFEDYVKSQKAVGNL